MIVKYVVGYESSGFSNKLVAPSTQIEVYCPDSTRCNNCAIDFKHNHVDPSDQTIYGMILCSNKPSGENNIVSATPLKVSKTPQKQDQFKRSTIWSAIWKIAGGLLIVIGVGVYVGFMLWLWIKRSELKQNSSDKF